MNDLRLFFLRLPRLRAVTPACPVPSWIQDLRLPAVGRVGRK